MSVQNPETEIAVIRTEMKNIQVQVSDLKTDMNKGFENLQKSIDMLSSKSEEKFAAKWVETGLKWGITLVLGAIIMAMLNVVLNKSNNEKAPVSDSRSERLQA